MFYIMHQLSWSQYDTVVCQTQGKTVNKNISQNSLTDLRKSKLNQSTTVFLWDDVIIDYKASL